jgi:hypothetical protein
MGLLDFIKNHNAPPAPPPSVESLPADVKAQAVEAARPAAELMEKATTPRTAPPQPSMADAPSRGRGLGWER